MRPRECGTRPAAARRALGAAAAGALALLAATPAVAGVRQRKATPRARLPAADCQPFARAPCLLPFPSNLFTVRDPATPTGLRVRLPADAMPANRAGIRIKAGEWDRSDGFSPGSTVIVHVPGLDSAGALERSGAAGLADVSRSLAADQPIVILDESTGARQLIWSELDARAPTPNTSDLLIHPAGSFREAHTYVVALRDLRDSSGRALRAPNWFARLRDGLRLPSAERPWRARYARIFAALARAGVATGGLYEAWDFTVASAQALTSRLLAIRNDAFAQLGDRDLGDGVVQGQPPSFAVTASDQLAPTLRRVRGTLQVACYLIACGESVTGPFHYASEAPDAPPAQIPRNVATAPFECVVPTAGRQPARMVLYGHGFLSSAAEVESPWLQEMAVREDIAFCASDWWGLASADMRLLIEALGNVNQLPDVIDTIQQGVLNALYLGRLMRNPAGLAADPALQIDGRPLIDTSRLYYYGNSVGGILGGVASAVAPDFSRAVLGVSGMDFFNLILPRGVSFAAFGEFALRNYRDPSLRPLVLDLLQQLWDRADPQGYAEQMTSSPPPDTPAHAVLMQIAYGDFQVSMYAAAAQARAIGAFAHQQALDAGGGRTRDAELLFGIPAIPAGPFAGSAIVIWDSGPGRTQPPPLANVPPVTGPANQDPHEDPRYTPAAQQQVSAFLAPAGFVLDVCGAQPCHSYAFAP